MDTGNTHKLSFLVLRTMGSLIFIVAGLNHLLQTAGATARLQQSGLSHLATWLAPAETLVVLSGIGLLAGGFMLLIGLQTRLAATLLLAILIPITVTVQLANPAGVGPLFKNVALAGTLLFFAVNGAMYYGLDQVLSQRKVAASMAVMATAFMMLLSSCAGTATAKHPGTEQGTPAARKYAVLISQPNHLKAAVNTAETITGDSHYKRESFVIMACGKSVEAFVKGGGMAPVFEAGQKAGVTYRVCGMSLKKFNIDQNSLMEGVEVVPNGLTHMFDLQLQGYSTVEL